MHTALYLSGNRTPSRIITLCNLERKARSRGGLNESHLTRDISRRFLCVVSRSVARRVYRYRLYCVQHSGIYSAVSSIGRVQFRVELSAAHALAQQLSRRAREGRQVGENELQRYLTLRI
jgi:hypothetical protein